MSARIGTEYFVGRLIAFLTFQCWYCFGCVSNDRRQRAESWPPNLFLLLQHAGGSGSCPTAVWRAMCLASSSANIKRYRRWVECQAIGHHAMPCFFSRCVYSRVLCSFFVVFLFSVLLILFLVRSISVSMHGTWSELFFFRIVCGAYLASTTNVVRRLASVAVAWTICSSFGLSSTV